MMSGSVGPIPSAVIVPETSAQSPPRKRRQSSISDSSPKRPRLSHDESINSPSTLVASPPPGSAVPESAAIPELEGRTAQDSEKRKSSVQEERKRSRRLFGGLLSALNQGAPTGQQRRRQEIEKRQAEKAKQQRDDDEVHRAERLVKLKIIRKKEQIKYDREAMRTRHSNMLARAHFLSTMSKPKLYYKPWELMEEEESRIKQQIADVEFLIDQEVTEFQKLNPEEAREEPPVAEDDPTDKSSKETVGEPRAESPPNPSIDDDPTNPPAEGPPPGQPAARKPSLEEHSGEVVVEADEDTVIY